MQKVELGTILKERYKITKQLGTGGMGEVFLADDLTLETQVAVKINYNLNDTNSAQFIREARLLASLKHPNLPRVIDYFTDNNCQYLVMDFIPGDDLKTIVERRDKIKPETIIKWAVELGTALTYLHNHKPPIFHRDIKPANIKLMPSGEVVLVDFGIAKTGEASQETQTGAWAFSPGFAPPEQVSGMRTGSYSDQYSLAATLYYLMVGRPPADSAQRMMGTIDYVPLKTANPAVDPYVSDAIGKALSIRPEDRFASVADFLTALTHPEVTVNSANNTKTVMAPRTASAAVLPPPPVAAAKPRKSSGLWIAIILILVLLLGGGGYLALNYPSIFNKIVAVPAQLLPATKTATATATIEAVISQATETPEVLPTETLMPTPTETVAPTAILAPQPIGRGGKVAFVSNRQGDGFLQIWLMDVGMDAEGKPVASNFQQLTTSPSDKSQPSWSPDGTKLLFTGVSTEFAKNGTPFAKDIYVVDVTQSDPTPVDLSKRAGDDVEASWAPSGSKIAFTSYYRDDGMPQLFLMNPNGSEQVRLSERFAEHSPVWTPNDSYLYYVMDYANHSVLSMRDIWSKYVNTKKFDMSTDAGRLGQVSQPKISLDGSMIVYTRTIGGKTNIYTATTVGRGATVTQLTDSDKDSSACWSPDAKWILFTSTRDDNAEIYIMTADGKDMVNLTNFPAEEEEPAWQPVALQ